jgi:hypothetical protein
MTRIHYGAILVAVLGACAGVADVGDAEPGAFAGEAEQAGWRAQFDANLRSNLWARQERAVAAHKEQRAAVIADLMVLALDDELHVRDPNVRVRAVEMLGVLRASQAAGVVARFVDLKRPLDTRESVIRNMGRFTRHFEVGVTAAWRIGLPMYAYIAEAYGNEPSESEMFEMGAMGAEVINSYLIDEIEVVARLAFAEPDARRAAWMQKRLAVLVKRVPVVRREMAEGVLVEARRRARNGQPFKRKLPPLPPLPKVRPDAKDVFRRVQELQAAESRAQGCLVQTGWRGKDATDRLWPAMRILGEARFVGEMDRTVELLLGGDLRRYRVASLEQDPIPDLAKLKRHRLLYPAVWAAIRIGRPCEHKVLCILLELDDDQKNNTLPWWTPGLKDDGVYNMQVLLLGVAGEQRAKRLAKMWLDGVHGKGASRAILTRFAETLMDPHPVEKCIYEKKAALRYWAENYM